MITGRYETAQKPQRFAAPDIRLDERQRYSVAEAAALLRQSVRKTWADIKLGRLVTLRDGRRTYVSGASLIQRSMTSDAA